MVRYLAIGLVVLSVAGCIGTRGIMIEQPPAATPADEATLVFIRDSHFGAAFTAALYDVTGQNEKFLGIIGNGNKVAYAVKPGAHRFMVVSETADFMEANVLAGKTYYAMVTPRTGVWRARFSLQPVRGGELSGELFRRSDDNTVFVANTPTSLGWARENAESVAAKRSQYWWEWQNKSADERASLTLNPADGR